MGMSQQVQTLQMSSYRYGYSIIHSHEPAMRGLFLDAWHEWVDSIFKKHQDT